MSERKTPGERIAARMLFHAPAATQEDAAREIDRAIRQARAEAWDEGWAAYDEWGYRNGSNTNPYRRTRK